MKLITIMLGFLLAGSPSQKKLNIDLIGSWKVQEVVIDSNTPLTKNPGMVNMLKNNMTKMVFNFKADHHIALSNADMPKQGPYGEWTYDPVYKLLTIKNNTGEDQRTLYIVVSKDDKGQVLFKMQNAPMTWKMKKQ